MNPLAEQVRGFASMILQRKGALVEWSVGAEEGMAILPADVAANVERDESVLLTTRPTAGERDALAVGLAGDFLDRAEEWLKGEPRIARVSLDEAHVRKTGIDEMVSRQFHWANARVRPLDGTLARCDYHQWYFLLQLRSEQRWEDVVMLTVNGQTGASAAIESVLESSQWRTVSGDLHIAEERLRHASARAAIIAKSRAAAFVARLQQQMQRDQKRIESYYKALLLENRNSRARGAEDPAMRADRKRAVNMEMQRKLLELGDRYAIATSTSPIALIIANMPVLAIRCEVTRKRASATHTLYWNPLLRSLEAMVCCECGCDCTTVFFTDDNVAAVCPPCFSKQKR